MSTENGEEMRTDLCGVGVLHGDEEPLTILGASARRRGGAGVGLGLGLAETCELK